MSSKKAEQLGLKLVATIRSDASAGVEPRIRGMGPVSSTRRCVRAGRANESSDENGWHGGSEGVVWTSI
jgi:acetyl-CoA acetyltransferase